MAMPSHSLLLLSVLWCLLFQGLLASHHVGGFQSFGPLVTKESRRTLVATDDGVVTAVDVVDGFKGMYHLQFITLEPSSLFLPVLLHADMVFYVQTGRGTVSWSREDSKDGTTDLDVEPGDVYRIEEGSIMYLRSHPDANREKLRIHAMFNLDTFNAESHESFHPENHHETFVGAYSKVSDLILGFDDRVLQMGFQASEEVVHAIKWASRPPPIVHFAPNKTEKQNWHQVLETLVEGRNPISLINGKKKKKEKESKSKTKTKTFNVFNQTPDVKNCNGWSVSVTSRDLRALRDSDIGVFMVNLTKGAMMGPHWNPRATEIAEVIEGNGMVQLICPSNPSGIPSGEPTDGFKCQNMGFKVKEGDVFIIPRFHPMAQMSFNNSSFVFVGFSTAVRDNHPQYLAGKWSVLKTIDRDILAMSLGTSNATLEKMLASQDEGVMLECTSCAEEAEKIMEEIERKRKEEEAKKREEEEARKREEEAKKREEEEEKKREEEEARKRKEEEEEKKREEEEARKREEEEARRKREEEEAKKREEEEERKREEEAEKREEEEERKKREEEEARERAEEEARKREEEERKKREEEEERKKREEEEARERAEEEARKREEEEERKKREEEEARERAEEEARKREEEERKKREEEARKEEEEIQKQEEEEIKRQEEEARERAPEGGGGGSKRE